MADKKTSSSRKKGIFANFLCDHDWVKRESWYQKDRASGQTAFKCSRCGKTSQKRVSRM